MMKAPRIVLCLDFLVVCAVCSGCSGPTALNDIPADTERALEPLADPSFGPNDWPFWRRTNPLGTVDGQDVPLEWSKTANVVWQSPVPGHGHSSPIITG